MSAAEFDDQAVSLHLRRDEAGRWLDVVFGDRPGYVAMAFGFAPYRSGETYAHRQWRERPYIWPAQRDTLLGDVAQYLADADMGGTLVDVYVCCHARRSEARTAETSDRRDGNALPPMWLHADLDGAPADPGLWAELDPLRVFSGTAGHEHGLVALDQPCEDIDRWYQLQRTLRDRLGGGADAKISDNDVLRLPGTINAKPTAPVDGTEPGDPTPVTVIPGWGHRVWTVADLAARLGVDLSQPAPVVKPPRAADAPPSVAVPVPEPLTEKVRDVLDELASVAREGGDRSPVWHRLVWAACSAGYSRDQTYSIAMARAVPILRKHGGADRYEQRPDMFDRSWTSGLAARDERQESKYGSTSDELRATIVEQGLTAAQVWESLGEDDWERHRQWRGLCAEVVLDSIHGPGSTAQAFTAAGVGPGARAETARPAPQQGPGGAEAPPAVDRDTETDTEPLSGWAFDPVCPTLDPERAVVFGPWVTAQVLRHLGNTRTGENAKIREEIRDRLGRRAPLAPLYARGRTLGGYAYYPEAGIDADALAVSFAEAAREAVAAEKSPEMAPFDADEMAAVFMEGWAAGLDSPQYPLDDPRDRRRWAPDGEERAVLPPASQMRERAALWQTRSWDGQSDGDRLVDHFGHELRWLSDAAVWAFYDGVGWTMAGAPTHVLNRARRMVDALPTTEALGYEGAPANGRTVPREDEDSPWAHFIRYVRSRRHNAAHEAMIKQAAGTNRVTILRDAFDPNPDLFNVANGVLDLRTGEPVERSPELLLMLRSGVPYDPAATAPALGELLDEALVTEDGEPDRDLHEYLQRVVGYSLTGHVDEHAMIIHYGPGLDVRRVFNEVLRGIFGDYAQTVPRGTLTVRRNETAVPNDLARMVGKRLLVASEPANGAALDDEMVSDLVGGQPVPARLMRAEWFEFRPVGKIHMFTEHMPMITGGPDAAQKLHVVEWSTVLPRARCQALSRALSAQLPGVLAWAVRGALSWRERGLEAPQSVLERTRDHIFHGDLLTQWVDDRLDLSDGSAVTETRDLYPAYSGRAERAGEVPLSEKAFSIALVEQHGVTRRKHPQTRRSAFFGVRLRPETEERAPDGVARRRPDHIRVAR